jgi:DNA (cytosine-5)-methyltransferase 1
MRQEPTFLVVDLFCGAGGTTTGFAMADGYAEVIACVNHDPKAIKSHWRNHPEVVHFEEDIRTLELSALIELVQHWQNKYPDALLILWASLECTNFSKAKGGQPRDADSRTLADHLERYIVAIDPDYIQIENVVEFMSWGPLDENGKPVSRKNGQDWMRWRKLICSHGYRDEWREMNSANYGAYTSRNRLFGIFAKDDLPIAWPESTHSKNPSKFSMHGDLERWKAVKEVLNFSDEGESIFSRKKTLSDKTLERIYAGLLKYVAKGDKAFISKYYSGKPSGKNISVEAPAGTVTCVDGQALVQPQFLTHYYSQGGGQLSSIDNPAPTVTTKARTSIVSPEFLTIYNGKSLHRSVDEPSPVIATNDRLSLVQPEYFIDKHYGSAQNQSIDRPAGTILPNDKHRLVEAVPFIMPTNYNNEPKSIDEPLQTITANRKHHYIVNPSHGGHSTSTDNPCPVIVARQDKAPLYLVQIEKGRVAIAVYEGDSTIMIKIKEFMVVYELVDIKMRMLRVGELLKIQGFPEGYQLDGNQADQKKFIGNSVVPHVVKAWTIALAERIIDDIKTKVA